MMRRAVAAVGCRHAARLLSADGAAYCARSLPPHSALSGCTSYASAAAAANVARARANPLAGVKRSFATDSAASAASYELLKKDFRKWLAKEAKILSLLLVVGTTGVYFYQNRENAPSNKVLKLLALAEQSAKQENRQAALQLCLQAHSITKATNSRDRHLFELAFAIAAQYETLGKVNHATLYYQEALGSLPYVPDAAKREMSRVVTLDRIAQCYQDKGEQVAAEKYYKEAIAVYDKSRAAVHSTTATAAKEVEVEQIDREIPAVLYNYGQQLMHLQRWDEAKFYLLRARKLAVGSSLPEENVAKIQTMLLDIAGAASEVESTDGGDDSADISDVVAVQASGAIVNQESLLTTPHHIASVASMLPQRQKSGKKPHAAHSQRVTVRKALFGALGAVFLVIFYFNFRFFSSSDARAGGKLAAAASAYEKKAALESKLLHDHRQPKQVVFTSGCSNLDLIHGEVLAYTVRSTGFDRNVTHLMYGCTDAAFRALVAKKNPVYNVKSYAFPAIKEAKYMFGEGQLTTTVHPQVLQQWISEQLAAPSGGELRLVKDNEFIMVVDSDAIFTKKVDVRSLFREVEDITDPRWFGQDASWFCPKRPPLDDSALKNIVPSSFPALEPRDWRPFAATAPFVLEFGVLKKILPSAVEFWSKLGTEKRYLAFPLAAAHNAVPIGISGVLSVHHYPSRYENWDFVDDIKHNPCNESATLRRIALQSYPITIRAQNFTLPPWIDGRDWNFFDSQIPVDILSCDAWLFKEPSGYLWHLASNTNGYERVPTILRRRHTMSVCLALHSYNSAIRDYKSHFCPFGYNANKKVPMELGKEAWATAVALAPQTVAESKPVVHFGDYKKKKSSDAEAAPKPGQAKSDDIHFVFSTTCEPYQDWQSQVLAHSFAAVKQRGRLTRIVSGCTDGDLKKAVELARVTPFMHLHITKDFSDRPTPEMKVQDDYAPYNKPFGIRDWLRTANPPMKESIVVIIDPDFMFLKPFVLNSDFRITKGKDVDSQNYQEHTEVIEGLRQYKPFFVYEGKRDLATVNDHVSNGVAIAQRWSSYLGAAGFDDPKGTNFQLCPDCKKTTKEDGLEYFSVGPPYAMTRHDLDLFINDYCNMTVGKRELHRDSWMAEMMGYVLAASRHDVKHTTFDNLALAGKEDEYWSFIDFIKGNPCADPVKPMVIAEVAPLLHGCHTYKGTDGEGHDWIYYKQYMPNDLFACDSWMLAVPPASVWTVAKSSGDKKKMQHAYGLCTSVKVVNQAIFDFKQKVCVDGFNQNKKLRLVDPRAAMELKVGQVHDKWVNAADEVAPKISTSAP